MNTTITGKLYAYISKTSGPENLERDGVNALILFSSSHMGAYGYVLVGEADVTVSVPEPKVLIEQKIAALEQENTAILADAQAKSTEIRSQIQKLLAISYEASND